MLIALAALALTPPVIQDALKASFVNPPLSARPHTWWHWMDGNVTREGITADLEAMKEVGIGGAQMFTVSQSIPSGPVGYMSQAWRDMTHHAIKEASRLGIELCLHNCAGWSSSGAPWVKPEHAMQVVAWSEVQVEGPREFNEVLPKVKAPQVYAPVDYSRDIAVFAFPAEYTPKRDGDFLGRTAVNRQDGLKPLTPEEGKRAGIPKSGVQVITTSLDLNGRLRWTVPAGKWTILRVGHVPTGKDNHPAPPEGDGLEVDKLSRESLDAFWEGGMAKVISDAGPLAGPILNNALVDSYEVGSQNWTPLFRQEFQRRRGYDMLPYLPVVAGFTVENADISDRFLWDYRRTIADLYADNYYGYFAEKCKRAGLLFSTEPYGNGMFDNIQAGSTADIPMGEFWIGGLAIESTKLAASVGHVYGKPIIGAESFTADDVRGRWLEEPYAAKTLGDLIFCNGINRYIFHRYAHQPWMNLVPGMTMGPWGTHLERTQTWWTEAKQWLQYVARCQSLLQQGRFVADVVYYYGEGAPVDLPYRTGLNPRIPTGYDYDGCDTKALMTMKVVNGMIVLPSGMAYRALILPNRDDMTPEVAAQVRKLLATGAQVFGPRPTRSPSLVNFPKADEEVRTIARGTWARDVRSFEQILTWAGPDFRSRTLTGRGKLAYIHRRIGQNEVYFVSNQSYEPTEVAATFRVQGLRPELWQPETGMTQEASIYRPTQHGTEVDLRLGPAESIFVVFRPGSGPHLANFIPPDRPKAIKLPKIVIKSARYETAAGVGADVTEIVSGVVRSGETEIPATNGLFGDPAVNVVKRLVVHYEVDGKPATQTVAENETVYLVNQPSIAPTAEFQLEKAGADYVFVPWCTGKYTAVASNGRQKVLSVKREPDSAPIAGPWRVQFAPNLGAPGQAVFNELTSWSENAESGIKYFSGSATYHKNFTVSPAMIGANRVVVLDMGKVKNFATITINGTELPPLWKAPFRADVTRYLKKGMNILAIKVTNLWPNRLIGDEQLPADVTWKGVVLDGWPDWMKERKPRPDTGRVAFTTWKFWNKDSPLLESGLLGPVMLRSSERIRFRL
ncbi:MAG: hypothetical protein K1X67_13955 [Fimbriimonadaceae bacterium]|nr:hypothetical protein [Fimbriimonadaceae bacterium]